MCDSAAGNRLLTDTVPKPSLAGNSHVNPVLLSFLLIASTLMMEAVCYSETWAGLYQTTRRYSPEGSTFHSNRCDTLRSSLLGHVIRHVLWAVSEEKWGGTWQEVAKQWLQYLGVGGRVTQCN
jgi:hypothetical protein